MQRYRRQIRVFHTIRFVIMRWARSLSKVTISTGHLLSSQNGWSHSWVRAHGGARPRRRKRRRRDVMQVRDLSRVPLELVSPPNNPVNNSLFLILTQKTGPGWHVFYSKWKCPIPLSVLWFLDDVVLMKHATSKLTCGKLLPLSFSAQITQVPELTIRWRNYPYRELESQSGQR